MPAIITPEQAAQEIVAGWAAGKFEIHFPKRFTLWLKVDAARERRHVLQGDETSDGAMSARSTDVRVQRIVNLFERFTPADVPRLPHFYATKARFKDPFNDVVGVAEIERVFAHMYVALDDPRFIIRDVVVDGDQCFLTWDFLFRFKRFTSLPQTVRGSSHLKFDASGLVCLHRDYWDAAEELYEKLPWIGALMRWLKRRAAS
jgi:hypothetical protein